MATERAIDKLKKAFSVDNKSSYEIYKNGQVVLKVYWTPLTIADRDTINTTLIKANRGQEEGSLDFALQVIIGKAEDESGNKLFTEADRASLRREIEASVLEQIQVAMINAGEKGVDEAKADLKSE